MYERRYRSLVSSLLYLTANRLDFMHVTSMLSRFMNATNQGRYGVAIRMSRYISGGVDVGV